jgi:ferredoxin/flavodoxin---NADP+ reductase
LELQFLRSTVEILGETEEVECGLVLRSVGYRGERIAGIPFDDRRGLILTSPGASFRMPARAAVANT